MSRLSLARAGRADDDTRLHALAEAAPFTVFQQLAASPRGLTEAEATERLARAGHQGERPAIGTLARARAAVASPFVGLLAALAVVFLVVGDARGTITIAVMVALGVALRWWQYTRSDRAVDALRNRVSTTVTVRRRAADGYPARSREIPADDLVVGDVVELGPGDLVPADVRLVAATDLRVDQSVLSGENLPVRKSAETTPRPRRSQRPGVAELGALCFAGTAVVSGSATGIVVATGRDTYFGALAREVVRPESSFDRGVRAVGWTLIRFMLVMVPIVLVVNGTVTGNWAEAAMFAAAVAVGLTPEMLPVIVTTNLARGAVRLSRQDVIVKRLNAIQDLGAMDVLCVDKTGTLTEDRVAFAHSIDLLGRPDGEAAEYANLAVHFQAAPADRLDEAIAGQLAGEDGALLAGAVFDPVAEIPFDHTRRRSTVVVRRAGEHILITKGDPDEVVPRCTHARRRTPSRGGAIEHSRDGEVVELTPELRTDAADLVRAHAGHGMRILAVAAKQVPLGDYEETDLVLVGFVGFVDPVRDSAAEAVRSLNGHGVDVKILTGDNRHVAAQVAQQAGIACGEIVLGHEIDAADDADLRALVARTAVFAKTNPAQKARIVAALRACGHAVGFIGDGVNDATALRTADVGIAADTATDVAKDAADLILTERDLTVLARGVVEGRRTLANTMKYVKITASSNFGNVLTVLAASAFLPFLPMLPIQLVVQNLLYDTAQLALPWDRVDAGYLRRPRRWDAAGLAGFMLVFGPLSTLFDLATFAALGASAPAMFQTGWFLEGLASQVLILLVLRTRGQPLRDRPSRPVLLAAVTVVAAGFVIALSPLAGLVGMHAPAAGYFPWLLAILLVYGVAAQATKAAYLRRRGTWL